MRDSIVLHVVNSLAIEPAIRSRPNPGDADYESAKGHRGDQCLADPIALPQTKQGGATAIMPKSCKDPLTVPVRMSALQFLHLWMQRTTSLCRNQTSQGVVIGNLKKIDRPRSGKL
jgi:hypothetical protein